MRPARSTNIELYRILAMEMIVILHFFSFANAGQRFFSGSAEYYFYHVVESLCICGVNMFVLITGYFAKKKKTVELNKILKLCIEVAFWGGMGYFLGVIFGHEAFSAKNLIKILVPIFFGGKWFVKAYILLLLFIPFLNLFSSSLRKNSFFALLIICLVVFSFWPALLPNPPLDDYGYSFVHLIFVYLIGAFIREHKESWRIPSKVVCLLGYFLCALVTLLLSLRGYTFAWAYNSFFVILEAVFLFLLFLQIDIKSSVINELASCAFGVFLIHTSPFFQKLIYEKLFHASEIVGKSVLIILTAVFFSAIVFYVFGYVLEKTKNAIFKPMVDRLIDRCSVFNVMIE